MSSPDTIELEELFFYQQLISSYADLYKKAQDVCSAIVIPQQLRNPSSITRDVIESHLFRPSPCYVRKHVSWNEKYEIEFDNNHTLKVFNKKEGAGERRLKVLSQEDVRDSIRHRAYSILVVEQPIVDTIVVKNLQNGLVNKPINKPSIQPLPKFDPSTASYESSFMYLDSLRQIEPAFARLRTHLFLFNETYVILPNFVDNAIEKLREYRLQFLQEVYQLLNKNSEDRDIELSSEIYITGNTYPKVWPIIVQHNEDKDQHLYENIIKRQQKQLAQATEINSNKNLSAALELKKLDDLKTSYEKAKCIHAALDLTVSAQTMTVDTKNSSVSYHSNAMPMAADETLTAFIDLICHLVSTSKSNDLIHLIAHEHYTEKFRFLPLPQNVDYAFTTYRGVLEYLSNSALWY